jgi:hypothetical protein
LFLLDQTLGKDSARQMHRVEWWSSTGGFMRFIDKLTEIQNQMTLPEVAPGKIRKGLVITVMSTCYVVGIFLGYFLIK